MTTNRPSVKERGERNGEHNGMDCSPRQHSSCCDQRTPGVQQSLVFLVESLTYFCRTIGRPRPARLVPGTREGRKVRMVQRSSTTHCGERRCRVSQWSRGHVAEPPPLN